MMAGRNYLAVVCVLLHGNSFLVQGLWLGECNKPLGLSSGEVPDTALSASSSHYSIVGPHRARLGREDGAGAWCPRGMVDQHQREYLQVDLPSSPPHLITAVGTQGRFDNNFGVEYTPAYTIEYTKPSSGEFVPYTKAFGSNETILLIGNTDTFTEIRNELERPLIANRLRIRPFSLHPRVVCLRLELYGCIYNGKLLYYKVEGRGEKYAVGEGILQDGIVITSFYGKEDPTVAERRSRPTFIKKDWEFLIEEGFKRLSSLNDNTSSSSNETLEVEEILEEESQSHQEEGVLAIPSLPPGEIIAPDFPIGLIFLFTERLKFTNVYLYLDPIHLLIAGFQPVLKAIIEYGPSSSERLKNFKNFTISLKDDDFSNITLVFGNLTAQVLRIHITADHAEVNLQEIYFEAESFEESSFEMPFETSAVPTSTSYAPSDLPKKTSYVENNTQDSEKIMDSFLPHKRRSKTDPPNNIVTLQGKDSMTATKLNLKRSSTVVWAVHTATSHRTYVGVAIGFSVGVGLLLCVWIWLWARTSKKKDGSPRIFRRPPPPDTLDMTCLMEGFQTEFGLRTPPLDGSLPTPTNEEHDCSNHFGDDSMKAPLVCSYPSLTVATVSSLGSSSSSSPFQYYSFGANQVKDKGSHSYLGKHSHQKKKSMTAFKQFQAGYTSSVLPSSSSECQLDKASPCGTARGSSRPKKGGRNPPRIAKEEKPPTKQTPLSFALQNDMFFTP